MGDHPSDPWTPCDACMRACPIPRFLQCSQPHKRKTDGGALVHRRSWTHSCAVMRCPSVVLGVHDGDDRRRPSHPPYPTAHCQLPMPSQGLHHYASCSASQVSDGPPGPGPYPCVQNSLPTPNVGFDARYMSHHRSRFLQPRQRRSGWELSSRSHGCRPLVCLSSSRTCGDDRSRTACML